MNKHFVNGKFNFNSDVEVLIKRKKAHTYLADARFRFLDSLVGRTTNAVDILQDIKPSNNNSIHMLRYLKRFDLMRRTIVYNDAIIGRLVNNGK